MTMKIPDTSKWSERWKIKFSEYRKTATKTEAECEDLKKLNRLLLITAHTHVALMKSPFLFDETRHAKERYSQSLVYTSLLELFRNLHNTVFLCACGLYKNAYHNLRYALEFIVQSYYIDMAYPDSDFEVRINVLAQIENNRKYRGTPLLKKLNLNRILEKDIISEYNKLHKKVHSTYKQFLYTAYHFMDDRYHAMYLDCKEVSDIYKATVKVLDFFYYLFLIRFPEFKNELINSKEFLKAIDKHELELIHEHLWN
jgi:hypothetical protein